MLERLTARNSDGQAYYPKCFEEPCLGTGDTSCTFCKHNDVVCERLAAYEDLGLTPGQLRAIDRMYAELCGKLAEIEGKKPE